MARDAWTPATEKSNGPSTFIQRQPRSALVPSSGTFSSRHMTESSVFVRVRETKSSPISAQGGICPFGSRRHTAYLCGKSASVSFCIGLLAPSGLRVSHDEQEELPLM